MKCTVCGAQLLPVRTDLPFKVRPRAIVILKDLPVLECENCTEYLMEDTVYEKVEEILSRVDKSAELEIVHFAA
jgi:YgiT-type zinc finger domain-containing protein